MLSRNKMRLCALAAAASVGAGAVMCTVPSSAAAVNDATVQSYEAQLAELGEKQQLAQQKIQETKDNIENVMQYKQALDESIEYTARKITTAESMIDELKTQIAAKEEEISETEEKIKTQRERFLARMAAMQEDGNVTYLELILGSEDLTTFLTRVDYVNSMLEYDNKVIADLRTSKEQIRKAEEEIEASIKTQEDTLTQLENDRGYYNTLSAESDSSLSKLESDEAAWKAEYDNYVAAEAELNAKLESYIAEVQKQANRVYVGGDFMWPLPVDGSTGISSHFGGRTLNGMYEYHAATDIYAPTGTPIYASNGGEVIVSEWHDSYGNYVVIDHGDGKATLYAHMSVRMATVGQTVSRGDVIGQVGNTGYSFGSHLHFEFRLNGERVDAEQYVPSPY